MSFELWRWLTHERCNQPVGDPLSRPRQPRRTIIWRGAVTQRQDEVGDATPRVFTAGASYCKTIRLEMTQEHSLSDRRALHNRLTRPKAQRSIAQGHSRRVSLSQTYWLAVDRESGNADL